MKQSTANYILIAGFVATLIFGVLTIRAIGRMNPPGTTPAP